MKFLRTMAGIKKVPNHKTRGVHVYFLLDRDGYVIYVGQSAQLAQRLSAHHVEHHSAWHIIVPRNKVDRVEGVFIALLNPLHNGNHPKFALPDLAYVAHRFFGGDISKLPNLHKPARAMDISVEELERRVNEYLSTPRSSSPRPDPADATGVAR